MMRADSKADDEDLSPLASLTTLATFPVHLFNDEHFAKCRLMCGVDASIMENFSFDNLGEGGGKGGDVMAFHQANGRGYIVKSISGNDQDALLRLAEPITAHMIAGDSLLSTILWHFEIRDGVQEGTYFVMTNCLPNLPEQHVWAHMFDLKGCCDDKVLMKVGDSVPEVHKRCFSCNTCWYGCDSQLECCKTCNTKERREYFQGKRYALTCKFPIDAPSKKYIDRVIANDTDFLNNSIHTMDYSLIMGTVTCHIGEEHTLPSGIFPNQPFLVKTSDSEITAYYFGIIDFLQEWTTAKKIAHIIKCCFAPKPISTVEPNAYGVQFEEYFADKFIVTEDAHVPRLNASGTPLEITTMSQPEKDAMALGASVAVTEEEMDTESKILDESKLELEDEVTEQQRDAYAAGHAVATEAFPLLPEPTEDDHF